MNSALKVYNKRKVDYEKIDLFKYEQENLKPSSVFILIFETNKEKEVLFLKRSNSLQYHKGEICFPGGSYEHEDQYLLNTAFREVEEEVKDFKVFMQISIPLVFNPSVTASIKLFISDESSFNLFNSFFNKFSILNFC